MRDCLERNVKAFEGLQLRQVVTLLDVLHHSDLRTRDYIKKRYLERAPRFEETLSFLTESGALQCNRGLFLTTALFHVCSDRVTDQDVIPHLVNLILGRRSRYQAEAFAYLGKFEVSDGKATHRPTAEGRSDESSVRNFLMELGVVSYDRSEDRYVLSPDHNILYARARCHHVSVSPSELQRIEHERAGLGLAAEVAVVSYERQRVGLRFADRIDHIARRNTAAGYDIQSVTLCEGDKVLPRYIEVKAVPTGTFRFYWTSNEMGVAKSFASWYYLYLMPVDKSGSFSLPELRVICDPYSVVLGSGSEWIVERGVVACSLKPKALARGAAPGSLHHE